MTIKRIINNILLTIPALIVGVFCAFIAFWEPLRVLWSEE